MAQTAAVQTSEFQVNEDDKRNLAFALGAYAQSEEGRRDAKGLEIDALLQKVDRSRNNVRLTPEEATLAAKAVKFTHREAQIRSQDSSSLPDLSRRLVDYGKAAQSGIRT